MERMGLVASAHLEIVVLNLVLRQQVVELAVDLEEEVRGADDREDRQLPVPQGLRGVDGGELLPVVGVLLDVAEPEVEVPLARERTEVRAAVDAGDALSRGGFAATSDE